MVEIIGSELFGSATLSAFEYICAWCFILYPLVSLPLIAWFWTNHADKSSFKEVQFELPVVMREKTGRVTSADVGIPQGDMVSSTSRHNITFIGKRKPALSLVKEPQSSFQIQEQLREAAKGTGTTPQEKMSDIARDIALSSESTPELRAAALDYLTSSGRLQRHDTQRISLCGS